MTSLDPLERVVSALARDPNLHRIKKLLYCACYGVWEDDTQCLNQVSLQEIVQGVWERSPTLEALQFQLNRVVKTLNKPVAYAHVANGVLQVLSELYLNTYDITQPVTVNRVQLPPSMSGVMPGGVPGAVPGGYGVGSPQPAQPNGDYQGYDLLAEYAQASQVQLNPVQAESFQPPQTSQISRNSGEPAEETRWFIGAQDNAATGLTPAQLSAQTAVRAHVLRSLSQHPEQRRLKKLLVCVCHNQWENNQSRLAALDWEPLLDDVRQLMPTLPGLEHVLQAIVNSLSKPVEYFRVAQLLLEIVTPLYEQERPDETQFFGVTPEPNARQADDLTQFRPSQAPIVQAPMAPAPAGAINRGVYAPPPARRASDGWAQASTASGVSGYSGSEGYDDEPATGMFAPQLPPSPMDQKYPPRSLPDGSPEAGKGPEVHPAPIETPMQGIAIEDAVAEKTAAITQVVASLPAENQPLRQQDGGAHRVVAHAIADAAVGDAAAQDAAVRDTAVGNAATAENDAFTLRLTLMRYVNPLMAKVVMFSALHHLFRFADQDWIELHHHSLDSLIANLEERYPNLIDLEVKLCGVAEQLEVPEQAMQAAAGLLKVLKPRYDAAARNPARVPERMIARNSSVHSSTVQITSPVSKPAEKATAIQFGPEARQPANANSSSSNQLNGKQVGSSDAAIAPQAISDPPVKPVKAEVLPADDAADLALMSNDLETDLALLAASLEDDGLSHPLEP